jgi:hypothetical protein
MKLSPLFLGLFVQALVLSLPAQVPQIINYQGRLLVQSSSFNGTGLFKLSLVNGDGTTTFWSNDGSGMNGREPAAAVPILVDHGTYAVALGDSSLSNMTPIPATVFVNSDVRLRIWFNDGRNGFERLSPDQRITAVGYAMVAGNVPDGAITAEKLSPGAAFANLAGASGPDGTVTLSSDPDSRILLRAGFNRVGQLTVHGDKWDQRSTFLSPRGFHNAVWTGSEMLAWGGGNFDFFNDGARYNAANDKWTPMSSSNAPSPRWFAASVWTGREMIIWGGRANFFSTEHRPDGGRYDPATDTWASITTNGAPEPRSQFNPVWAGSEVLIWAGMVDGNNPVNSGARYNPATDTWAPMSTDGAPSGRVDYGAVWTGREMIIWGGWNIPSDITYADGARYNPATDTWRPISADGAPPASHGMSAVWTGSEMVIWGGRNQPNNQVLNVGARYDPATDTWRPLSTENVAEGRFYHTTIWTGSEMIVWGGSRGGGLPEVNSGGRYNPASDSWALTSTEDAPAPRLGHTAVWTDRGMLVLAGYQNHPSFEVYNSVSFYRPGKAVYVYEKP